MATKYNSLFYKIIEPIISMNRIKRTAQVVYSPQQMFELVNSIEEYPRFLPWCHEARVLHRDEKEVEGSLDIVWSGIHKTFTTRNYLHPYECVEIMLIKGPFRHLKGRWTFIPLGDSGCEVDLDLEFDLAGRLVDKLFQPIFHNIANSLVDLFCQRAVEVYGRKEKNNS
jgi:ribosome-associated toxin RatA of RatAB toxin-antitoxin module